MPRFRITFRGEDVERIAVEATRVIEAPDAYTAEGRMLQSGAAEGLTWYEVGRETGDGGYHLESVTEIDEEDWDPLGDEKQ